MGWKIGGAISAILAVVAALVTLTTAPEYKTGIEWVIAVIFAVLAILCFWRAMKASAAKKAKLAANQTFMTDQDLEQIQNRQFGRRWGDRVVKDRPFPLIHGRRHTGQTAVHDVFKGHIFKHRSSPSFQ